MTHFVISFRIHSDTTYQDRYNSFVDQVRAIGGGIGGVWEETSSFFAIEATGSAASICDNLYFASAFDSSKDVMLVIDLDSKNKATKGPIKYPNILSSTLGF